MGETPIPAADIWTQKAGMSRTFYLDAFGEYCGVSVRRGGL